MCFMAAYTLKLNLDLHTCSTSVAKGSTSVATGSTSVANGTALKNVR